MSGGVRLNHNRTGLDPRRPMAAGLPLSGRGEHLQIIARADLKANDGHYR
jgi:hypothetical protein